MGRMERMHVLDVILGGRVPVIVVRVFTIDQYEGPSELGLVLLT